MVGKLARWMLAALMIFTGVEIGAQINGGSPPYTFTSLSEFSASRVNENFNQLYSDALSRSAGTVTGNLTIGTGQLLADPGTVSLPGYSFDGDPDSGIYAYGADTLGFTLGGVLGSTMEQNFNTKYGTAPAYRLRETDATTDNAIWDFLVSGEQFVFRVLNNAQNVATTIFSVDRTGTTVDSLQFNVGTTAKSLALSALTPTTNGTVLYCSDCLKGSTPCTASSTGSMAKRENGAWNCD